ncbi:MAG TPA: class I SAM-dependent rRNA methyltransferase [Anaerolineae bacterium]|nr:class I SAM-dependent rRNA methyltransferase [Anaerolineae bacterium]
MIWSNSTIKLKKKRDRPIRQGHPWIFSGAVEEVKGDPQPGDLVTVLSKDSLPLGTAYYNPHSQIRARMLTPDADRPIDTSFWQERIEDAYTARQALPLPQTDSYRLINAESDRIPGLIVDKYGDYLVFQSLTAGIERQKDELVNILRRVCQPKGIIERSDSPIRQKEGLEPISQIYWGQPPPDELIIHEYGIPIGVQLLDGHKTGFYLDQRENRALIGQESFVAGKHILNLFAYTGGFALHAAQNGAARITNVDSSQPALEQAEKNINRLGLNRENDEYILADVFELLRYYRQTGQQFDLIISDPPKFAHSRREIKSASRGYKDLNWLSLRLLRPGGLLATFSCSGAITPELFQQILFSATVDAQRDVQIIYTLSQAADHPIAVNFPESAYLKGFLCRVW